MNYKIYFCSFLKNFIEPWWYSVFPAAVGVPPNSGGKKFVDFCEQNELPADFISTYHNGVYFFALNGNASDAMKFMKE